MPYVFNVTIGHTYVQPCNHGVSEPHEYRLGSAIVKCDGRRVVAGRWDIKPQPAPDAPEDEQPEPANDVVDEDDAATSPQPPTEGEQ